MFQDSGDLGHRLIGDGLLEETNKRGLVRCNGCYLGDADQAGDRQAEFSMRRAVINVVWPSIVTGARDHSDPNDIERARQDAIRNNKAGSSAPLIGFDEREGDADDVASPKDRQSPSHLPRCPIR